MTPFDTMFRALSHTAPLNRRNFLRNAGQGLAASTLLGGMVLSAQAQQRSAPDKNVHGGDVHQPIELKPLDDPSERQDPPVPTPAPPDERVGYAIVGLGTLALNQVLPAFGQCRHSKPVALVSGHRDKALKAAAQYGIREQNIYDYRHFDEIRNNPDIQAVYIVLPNSMHAEYSIRAAQAGKHVLCEKPMATSSAEARNMIEASRKAGKKLMIAYRIQYEPHHRQIRQWLRDKEYGQVKLIEMLNTQHIGDPEQWRLKKALSGGGALPDIGLYCLNTARFLTGEEPERVFASTYSSPGDARFREVEEAMFFQLLFPGGIVANCSTSYGVHESRRYRCLADKGGWMGMDPAFPYEGLKMEVSKAKGKMEVRQQPDLGAKNQFALEIDHCSLCIRQNKTPFTPGEEGLQDQLIMEALYQSAQESRPVSLERISKLDAFRGWQGEEQ